MADDNVAGHTATALREIRDRQQAQFAELRNPLAHIETNIGAMKHTDGAILSMLGGMDDALRALARRVDKMEPVAETLAVASDQDARSRQPVLNDDGPPCVRVSVLARRLGAVGRSAAERAGRIATPARTTG